jgi:GntR family transcriptional regulator, L-lactate dehydrogenase operon regulator
VSGELAAAGVTRADEAVFRPVRAGNAFEETVERLLSAIRLGVVPPGERLPAERELAATLKVSRVTVREAIGALVEAGYVASRRGRYGGTFVLRSDAWVERDPAQRPRAADIDDALMLRAALEVGAAEAAAGAQLGPHERRHLRKRLEDCAGARLPDYRSMDSRLHLAIAEVAGSTSLTAAVADVRMRVNELLDGIPLLQRNLAHSNNQHRVIVTAVLDGEPEAARRAMSEHLAGTAALLHGFLA